jgi:hypothetical protein
MIGMSMLLLQIEGDRLHVESYDRQFNLFKNDMK